jgi:hypothetical protein
MSMSLQVGRIHARDGDGDTNLTRPRLWNGALHHVEDVGSPGLRVDDGPLVQHSITDAIDRSDVAVRARCQATPGS